MTPEEAIPDVKNTMSDVGQEPALLSIRPYARLLTMLGEQLLKNECVALVELIKNSYDADADTVEVKFDNFTKDMKTLPRSRIVVRDNGCGMTAAVVKTAWMNPATPTKFLAKKKGKQLTPEKKRVLQGEKGIGRFAVLKLAKKITVTTRVRNAAFENVVSYDFTQYDDDFIREGGEEKEIFLDEVKINWKERTPEILLGTSRGTVIEMEVLKGEWNDRLIDRLCRDVANLTDPMSRLIGEDSTDRFDVNVVCNGQSRAISSEEKETLKSLIEDKAVFSISGRFLSKKCAYQFNAGSGREEVGLYDERIRGLWIWRQRYPGKEARMAANEQIYVCGDFAFQFYIFDFSRGIDSRFALSQNDKNRLKNHRVYLYRDGVRVYPYGDPDDDWLNIDVTRGIGRAGNFFSNDQIIGWVDITQAGNPELRDKTNREGLIETGGASEDFVFLIRTFLSHIKNGPFLRYQTKQRQKNVTSAVREGIVTEHLTELKEALKEAGQTSHLQKLSKIESEYQRERKFLSRRAEMTEDLAGVGMSVEMASHDIMLLVGRAQDIGTRLAQHVQEDSISEAREHADMLANVLQQIVNGMRDVQSLFRSSRRRRKVLKVEPILDKIHDIYEGLLKKFEITYNKAVIGESPVVANTTDGVIMQVLINLFDNAAYWLDTKAPSEKREIRVTLNGDNGELVFADNGPGIQSDDEPYIFEAFFSGKGQEGRGLGLYIARQLIERYGYEIELCESRSAVLCGANFVVRFRGDKT